MMRVKLSRRQRKGLRWFGIWFTSFLTVVLLVPLLFVRTSSPNQDGQTGSRASSTGAITEKAGSIRFPVFLSESGQTQQVELESYVLGVVAAEMPVEFELEALKAQAMASRTYIVRRLLNGELAAGSGGGAIVTDTIAHQAYMSEEALKSRWTGDVYTANMAKLRRAVEETKDKVLTYQGEPIDASFFSTSNGYTENSEDYWNVLLPYLRSVESPWDAKLSPRFKQTVSFTSRELQQRLALPAAVPVLATAKTSMKVLETTEGHRIKKLSVGGKTFSGREVREKLGLSSSQFQWSFQNGKWEFTTFGYGHGVGMSQWGANGMAKEGRTAEEIVTHYYTGISIGSAAKLVQGKSF